MNKIAFVLIIGFLFSACKTPSSPIELFVLDIPNGFPSPYIPEENKLSHERIALGKRLFYETGLSSDKSISCGSCHKQEFAFSDNQKQSPGVGGRKGNRNSMSLSNMAYQDFFLREGGVPSLEMQALVPIQDHNEMDYNIIEASERLNQDSSYIRASQEAYSRDIDPYVIGRALASFQRTLISGNSKDDLNQLNFSEQRGKELFFSEALNCGSCHGGFLYTQQGIENNGLHINFNDKGRYLLTLLQEDIGKFKVPSLRNIEFTSPYMHDGSLESLEQVIAHYASGGKQHPNQSPLIKEFEISETETQDLINFLESLSDLKFLNNSKFSP
jgi:cytochrome c peroxidase